MKLSKIKTVLKYQKNTLPILHEGVQINKNTLAFSNLQTYVYIENYDEPGRTYGIDKSLYRTGEVEGDYLDFPNKYDKGNEVFSFELDDTFKGNVKKLIPFLSKDELRPVMCGIFLDKESVTGTDAHVLGTFEHDFSLPSDFECIIPKEFCEFVEFADTLKIFEAKNGNSTQTVLQLSLVSEGKKLIIESRTIDGNYPRFRGVIPSIYDYNQCVELLANDLKEIDTLVKRKISGTPSITLGDKIELFEIDYKSSKKVGEYNKGVIKKECFVQEVILMPTKTIEGKFTINPNLLKNICKGASKVSIYFNEINKACFLDIEYKKVVAKKKRTVAELEIIISNLEQQNDTLVKLLEAK